MSSGIMIDSYVLIKPSSKMCECIKKLDSKLEVPPRIKSVFSKQGFLEREKQNNNNSFLTTAKDYSFIKSIDHKLNNEHSFIDMFTNNEIKTFSPQDLNDGYLRLEDLIWLNNILEKQRSKGQKVFLHEVLQGSVIFVPENEKIERNPELEKRCSFLKTQQENMRYKSMTKNVDNVRIRHPDEIISYQMKQLNKQLIAVSQFVISVLTGFAFGFIGIELMVGNLDFGFRLLLGIMCALTIALAELYFLAKQLIE